MKRRPAPIAMNPNNLNTLSETSGSLLIIFLNLSGKAKYGNPSIINTSPKTDKKYLKLFPYLQNCWGYILIFSLIIVKRLQTPESTT